ncbi:MAG: DNA-processing protein DprA [Bacteroidales bacterium]
MGFINNIEDNTREDELVYAIALSQIFYYECAKSRELIDKIKFPSDIFNMNKSDLETLLGRNNSTYIDKVLNKKDFTNIYKEIEWAEKHGIKIYWINDSTYPKRLRECCDAPLALFYKGNADLNAERIIAIVGTRSPTVYGRDSVRKIIKSLSMLDKPPIILSGLAYGIDITAHRQALSFGLDTIGVVAHGLDMIYPNCHRNDAAKMTKQGGILTDFTSGTTPFKNNFRRRNRIIAGLANAVILIESTITGGGMLTMKMADSYDRDLFAVPGRINDLKSEGCNQLIHSKLASAIYKPVNIANSLGWRSPKDKKDIQKIIQSNDNEIIKKILTLLSTSSMNLSSLHEKIGDEISPLLINITNLEIEGRIFKDIYGMYSI